MRQRSVFSSPDMESRPARLVQEGSPRFWEGEHSGGWADLLLASEREGTLLQGARPTSLLPLHVASESPFQVNSLGWEPRRAGHLLCRATLRSLPLPARRQASLPGALRGRPAPERPGSAVEGAAGPGPELGRQGPEPPSGAGDGTHGLEGTGTRRGAGPRVLRQAPDTQPPPPVALRGRRPTGPGSRDARLRGLSGRLTMLTRRVTT